MGVVAGADGMAQGVDGSQAFLERCRPHGGCGQHAGARRHVVALLHGPRQMIMDHPHSLQRDPVAEGMERRRTVGLETMGQGVHAGRRRQVRR